MTKCFRIVLVLWACAFCATAFAHAKLRSSIPANNSRLAEPPKTLSLVFNEDVQLAVLKLNSATTEIPVAIDAKAKAAPSVTVTLPPLPPGNYQASWSALSPRDGHIMKGHLAFSVLAPR